MDPKEADLRTLARRAGLTLDQSDLVVDLCGWNNRDGSLPSAYAGISPPLGVRVNMAVATSAELEIARRINQLLRHLLGNKLDALKGDLAAVDLWFSAWAQDQRPWYTTWLCLQLGIPAPKPRERYKNRLIMEPPEGLCPVVTEVLCTLIKGVHHRQ